MATSSNKVDVSAYHGDNSLRQVVHEETGKLQDIAAVGAHFSQLVKALQNETASSKQVSHSSHLYINNVSNCKCLYRLLSLLN
jgi:hypothetical protein